MDEQKDKQKRKDGGTEEMEKHEPPRTTQKGVTSPKFGSAGSGGAEYEPLPEQHDEDDSKIHES